MRRRSTPDVLVLCYHAVSETWPAPLSVRPETLEWQLGHLVRRGFRGATFTEAVDHAAHPRTLVVTFDDAYASVLERALPILSRLGLPGTVFAATDHVGHAVMSWPGIDRWLGTPHEGDLAGMSWDQLGSLAAAGWEVGSHTRSHPRLTELDAESLSGELSGSRQEIEERLGAPCLSLAYPYGDTDDRVVAAAGEAGYRAAAALESRLGPREPLRWPRVGVYHDDARWRFRLKVSPLVRRVRGGPAWGAVERARRVRRR
jgi:peptidoglycan/xylan/chitin deacetylase (PgdA/CDA1 family)